MENKQKTPFTSLQALLRSKLPFVDHLLVLAVKGFPHGRVPDSLQPVDPGAEMLLLRSAERLLRRAPLEQGDKVDDDAVVEALGHQHRRADLLENLEELPGNVGGRRRVAARGRGELLQIVVGRAGIDRVLSERISITFKATMAL